MKKSASPWQTSTFGFTAFASASVGSGVTAEWNVATAFRSAPA